ncbi:MAG: sigma-70 family RNA polymerase sigma factor [Rhodocyclaceae bacterium]|nr:sigma-70 family RNA polymerase sigma factor [Rhodocyclaceae bacterium]
MTDLSPHLPRLRRYARALTGERFAADDLVQDTLERALSRFALFRHGTRLDAWLLTIMHNLFVNQVRRQATQPPHDSIDEEFVEPAMPATQGDALGLRDLDRALAQLPVEQREVLLLVSLEELSYEETAKVLGIPLGTVMSRLSRGRERLRAVLAGKDAATPHLKVVK